MTYNILRNTLATALLLGGVVAAQAQNADTSSGNCAIWAEMSAHTVKKDARFDGHSDIASALMAFSKAQTAKLDAEMPAAYENSKAFGWDKAKVDAMMAQNDAAMRAGFFTSTMDKSKLYMDHVQAVYACANAQKTPTNLGQSPEKLVEILQKMAQTLQQ